MVWKFFKNCQNAKIKQNEKYLINDIMLRLSKDNPQL